MTAPTPTLPQGGQDVGLQFVISFMDTSVLRVSSPAS